MEKLKLDLDLERLEVTSFDPAPEFEAEAVEASYPKPNCSAIDLCPTRPC